MQDIVRALEDFDGFVLLGSPGSGKSTLCREVRALLEERAVAQRRPKHSVVHAAHSAAVAANTGAKTLASALCSGKYTAGREKPYCGQAEQAVAAISHMVLEEAPAWGPLVFRNAFKQIAAAVKQEGKNPGRLQKPFCGVKVVFSGDEMQRLPKAPGIGSVDGRGVAWPVRGPANLSLWDVPEVRNVPKLLWLVLHGNHRLQGDMLAMYESGCVPRPCSLWYGAVRWHRRWRSAIVCCSAEGEISEDIKTKLENKIVSWAEMREAPFLHQQQEDAAAHLVFAPPRTVLIVDSTQRAEDWYWDFLAKEHGNYRQAYIDLQEGREFCRKQKMFYRCVFAQVLLLLPAVVLLHVQEYGLYRIRRILNVKVPLFAELAPKTASRHGPRRGTGWGSA